METSRPFFCAQSIGSSPLPVLAGARCLMCFAPSLLDSLRVVFPAACGALFEIIAMWIEDPRVTPMNTSLRVAKVSEARGLAPRFFIFLSVLSFGFFLWLESASLLRIVFVPSLIADI